MQTLGAEEKHSDIQHPQMEPTVYASELQRELQKEVLPDQTKKIPGLPEDAHLIDEIKVVLYNEDGNDIITKSDIDRPSLDGTFRDLEQIVVERLMYLDAKKFKMISDEGAIERHLKAVQRENNLSLDQLKEIFKAAGYTFDEGRAQFGIMTSVNNILDFKVRSRLNVPERDIIAYYDSHPIMLPEEYYLARAVVPFDQENKEALRNDLSAKAQAGNYRDIAWQEPVWIEKGDLAEDKAFITTMAVGEISQPMEQAQDFELFRLVDRKPERRKSLEERRVEISNELRRPRYETLMNQYKKDLFDNASIIYF